ncbi:MAG: cysteine desulfurase [Gammaproteobacteria bacterium]|nr:cysteine desulfurase [Gammaproteobacteria bacterium]MBT8105335.1 cysteine desulfurase [Gammaproteobacteria bacterium]NNF48535.1 cysteine desulfurase [Woeseiaceae bacterium]NNK25349.1 cysteine desulfurase [Woeseiaceae bacterium]NNL63679.1 cysteine desulfurase [Woeseiaceae bacterium]
MVNAHHWRADFPALDQSVHGNPLIYLDSAASAQQPASVIDTVARYQREDHSNVHRGVHTLSHRATEAYEGARDKIAGFINANSRTEIVLTSGTTESINLVAQSFCRPRLQPGDTIVISHLEHHANIVPWQLVCEQTGAELAVAPIDERGEIDVEAMLALIDDKTFLVGISHVANALGTICPVERIIEHARAREIPVLVDGAQAVPHMQVDVQALDCDFYAFSGHKMFGPTGTGVLWGREDLLDTMPPWQGGGDMILEVTFDRTTWNELPYKFEAGTPNISGVIGLGAAIDYLRDIGMQNVAAYENDVHDYMVAELAKVDGIRLVGEARRKASVQSFLLDDIHSHDVGTILDHQGVAIRTGHHCAMPVMQYFGIPGTARASLALYNNREDIDRLVAALQKAREIFA